MDAQFYCSQLLQFFHDTKGPLSYQCATYRYEPQQHLSERHLHTFSSEHIVFPEHIDFFDMSILSGVVIEGIKYHIPMLDAATDDLDALHRSIEQHFHGIPYVIFRSGRSFHVYFETLLNEEDWITFMADALLMNLPGQPPISDSRWIGHRLKDRTASLRLTAEQSYYLQRPTLTLSQSSFLKM